MNNEASEREGMIIDLVRKIAARIAESDELTECEFGLESIDYEVGKQATAYCEQLLPLLKTPEDLWNVIETFRNFDLVHYWIVKSAGDDVILI